MTFETGEKKMQLRSNHLISRQQSVMVGASEEIRKLIDPNYIVKNVEFQTRFPIEAVEKLITDFSCCYQSETPLFGSLYASREYLCFFSNLVEPFSSNLVEKNTSFCNTIWDDQAVFKKVIPFGQVMSLKKSLPSFGTPKAIQVRTVDGDSYQFTDFADRNFSFKLMHKLWRMSLTQKDAAPDSVWLSMLYSNKLIPYSKGSNAKNGFPKQRMMSDLSQKLCTLPRETCSATIAQRRHTTATVKRDSRDSGNELSGSMSISTDEEDDDDDDDEEASCCSSRFSDNVFETCCSCAGHVGSEMMNEVLPLSIDNCFSCVFEQGTTLLKLNVALGRMNYSAEQWTFPNDENQRSRTIVYKVRSGRSMGFKKINVVEKQTIEQCNPGHILVTSEIEQSSNMNYGTSFDLVLTFCMTRVSDNTCRLRGFGCAKYRQRFWGIKKLIEKTANAAAAKHFRSLTECLRLECSWLQRDKRHSINRFQSCSPIHRKLSEMKAASFANVLQENPEVAATSNTANSFNRMLFVPILILIVLNIIMYIYVWLRVKQ